MATDTHRPDPQITSHSAPVEIRAGTGSAPTVDASLRTTTDVDRTLELALLRAYNAALRARLATHERHRTALIDQYEALLERERTDDSPDAAAETARRRSAPGLLERLADAIRR